MSAALTAAFTAMMHLSQGQLNLLALCPRKFQYFYLDHVGALTPPEQQEHLAWGSRFHLLMQQYELGLLTQLDEPIDPSDHKHYQFLQALLHAAPDLFQTEAAFRESEHRRTLTFEGYLLTVIYDLLILDEQHAQILDWKTYARPQTAYWLQQHWQTRLYPFVLAETSTYAPEQISMTYWFIPTETQAPQPQPLRFTYSADRHQQTQHDLRRLLNQLTQWLQDYDIGEPFPQASPAAGSCDVCPFALRCQRTVPTSRSLLPFAEIEEITL